MDPLLTRLSAAHFNDILGLAEEPRVRDVTVISDVSTLVSRIIRLRLTYDGPANASPGSLIAKTTRPGHRQSVWSTGEAAFYTDVAPSLPAGLVPRCFEARHGDATTSGHVILEDLTDTHEVATEWPLPPPDARCRTIVSSLARFHAAWWDDPRLGFTIGAPFDDAAIARFIEEIAGHFGLFADRLGDELSGERRVFYDEMFAAAPRLFGDRYRDARNVTITHGDAHVWNCFLPRNKDGEARWFDWNSWRVRIAADDLAYMMAAHWYPDRRRRSEAALLGHYHAVLLENGVRNYTLADLWDDYRLSVLRHTFIPVLMAGLKLPPVLWWNNFQRIMAAVDDLGCRALLG